MSAAVTAPELLLSPKQAEIRAAYFGGQYEIVAVTACRQVGKSYLGGMIQVECLLNYDLFEDVPRDYAYDSLFWSVAPNYKLAELNYRRTWSLLTQILGIDRRELGRTDKTGGMALTYYPTGNRVEFKSADRQGYLVGATLGGLHVDEAQRITDPRIIYEDLFPTVAVNGAPILITGTPKKAVRWYREVWDSGDPEGTWKTPRRMSFRLGVTDNPCPGDLVRRYHEVAEAVKKGEYPLDSFKQEWCGEWVADEGTVFRNLADAIKSYTRFATRNWDSVSMKFVIGLDIGTSVDYTAASIYWDGQFLDYETGKRFAVCHEVQNWDDTDYVRIATRLRALSDQYGGAPAILDGTGLPEPIKKIFESSGVKIHWFVFDRETRPELLSTLQSLHDRQAIAYPLDRQLINDLENFIEVKTAGGNVRAEAGAGFHDDRVMALALGAWFVARPWYAPIRLSRGDARGGPDIKAFGEDVGALDNQRRTNTKQHPVIGYRARGRGRSPFFGRGD